MRAAPGTAGRVSALKAVGNRIIAGGLFTNAGGVTASNIAVWDGANWSPLGGGVDGAVDAIEILGTRIYVAGRITNAFNALGGLPIFVGQIAYWEWPGGWQPAGHVIGTGAALTLCAAENVLYAGGSFTNISGTPVNRIAMLRDGVWQPLGTGSANGVNGTVYAILADGGSIYVGGAFTNAGGVMARAIAKWDGATWSALGAGMLPSGTSVRALAKLGPYIYAAGTFTNAGGAITRCIARWDGTKWEALGSGIGNDFSLGAGRGDALAVWGADIYVGGFFETAGVWNSGYIARWNENIDFSPRSTTRLETPAWQPPGVFSFRITSDTRATRVIERSEDLQNWTPILTNCALCVTFIDTSTANAPIRLYRTRQIP